MNHSEKSGDCRFLKPSVSACNLRIFAMWTVHDANNFALRITRASAAQVMLGAAESQTMGQGGFRLPTAALAFGLQRSTSPFQYHQPLSRVGHGPSHLCCSAISLVALILRAWQVSSDASGSRDEIKSAINTKPSYLSRLSFKPQKPWSKIEDSWQFGRCCQNLATLLAAHLQHN